MNYKKMEEPEHRCLKCGDVIAGRTDKKFCSDECRNAYHYMMTKKIRMTHTRIIGAINTNYKILDNLVKMGVSSIELGQLSLSGFNTAYFTSCRRNKVHTECYCYEIHYFITDTKLFNIGR